MSSEFTQNSKSHSYVKPFRTTLVQLTDETHLPCLPDSVTVARNDYSHNTSSLSSLWIITGFGTLKSLGQIQITAHHLLFLMCPQISNDVTTRKSVLPPDLLPIWGSRLYRLNLHGFGIENDRVADNNERPFSC
jgi:hypothetical protein